ncbi:MULTISPECIES: acetyl-CoA carboxylase biotin carboxyl carrier protein [Rhizobium/Agrobacterium group]|uniref:acetyl-CoA carboxylase biotin carboxyl carrier protein n=1 Tax=Rhizobium/Agrobacterium group TaxID=227290 RepID=UPI00230087FD|nr:MULTISPECIES: acetyl-CoA carboxylase biotin carboxyl carrier protein [Rhizobium/Agrobacterium group]MDA5633745.1 acetyl-CoA carboxylase biotin carboxyl carrier protein [Agrobacterium sp. ST15.16.024]MDF1891343.1 acetyl-CoA carboxylase biotin carboxyl carrier protein [Rhizobium rhizogenes]
MDLEKIKKLIEFVGSSRVSELTVSQEGTTVRIIRENSAISLQSPSPQPRPVPVAQTASETPRAEEQASASTVAGPAPSGIVAAPSFGLFHRAPSPGTPPFVEAGDEVRHGQELFIIEAMKVFNTVRAERSGRIARFLANDGEDVELGQPVLEFE